MTRGTNEDHIGLRPKVCGNILGSLYSKTRDPNSDFDGILFINKQINGEVKPNIGTVPMILR